MTTHRPHPLTGPYPYGVDPDRDTPEGEPTPLVARIPLDESEIFDDPEDVVLYDGCPRCTEHSHEPLGLDPERLGVLWRRMVEVERDPDCREGYRTATEADACRWLYRVALLVERTHPTVDPWAWPWHLRAGNVSFALAEGVRLTVAGISIGGDTVPTPRMS